MKEVSHDIIKSLSGPLKIKILYFFSVNNIMRNTKEQVLRDLNPFPFSHIT